MPMSIESWMQRWQ